MSDFTQAAEEKEKEREQPKEMAVQESYAKSMLRDEFLINMQKFSAAITRTIQQVFYFKAVKYILMVNVFFWYVIS